MSNLLDLPDLSSSPAPPYEPALSALADELAADAAARDLAGGHAVKARETVRSSGLLALSVPPAHGGTGAPWTAVLHATRRLARVDSAMAHLFAFHHLQVASLLAWGSAAQQTHWLGRTVAERLFWGNALNPLDRGVVATAQGGGWRLDGRKSYTSGARGADALVVSAWHEPSASLLIGIVDGREPGLVIEGDWDAFGQRQTDSGSARFEAVPMPADAVLQRPGTVPTPFGTLRPQFSQLVMANLYLGLAEGALAEARERVLTQSRPWFASGVARAADDPFLQHRAAELRLATRAAELLTDDGGVRYQAAWERGDALDADERGAVAVAVAEAKVLAHRAALDVGTQIFDLLGARAVGRRDALDRYWRNARVHTLHDPVDYKLRDIGRYALEGRWPEPTPYS